MKKETGSKKEHITKNYENKNNPINDAFSFGHFLPPYTVKSYSTGT